MGEEKVWATWKAVIRPLPVWRMPFEWIASPSMWSLFGVDFLSGLRRNRSTQEIFELLAPLSVFELRRVHALAAINHRRQEVVSRAMAIASITLPASAALTLSELSPQTLRAVAAWEGFTSWYLMLAYVGAIVAYYLMCAWRARQLMTVIEMHCVDRGVLVGDGGAPADSPLEEGFSG